MKQLSYTAVIILNYNNYEDTICCIQSVEKYNTADIKFIVVDNGSTRDGAVESLDMFMCKEYVNRYKRFNGIPDRNEMLPYCSFIVSGTNAGYARGNNIGLQLAMCDESVSNVMILNNDVLFVEDIIPPLLDVKQQHQECAIISPMLFKKNLVGFDDTCARLNPTAIDLIIECLMSALGINEYRDTIKRKYWLFVKNPSLRNKKLLEVEMPSGSCMLLSKEFFHRIGFFDPCTFLYFEENILSTKIKSLGMKNYLVPNLKCIHLGASSTKKTPSAFVQKCGLNSRAYYLKTYCHLNPFEKLLFALAKNLMRLRLLIKSKVK